MGWGSRMGTNKTKGEQKMTKYMLNPVPGLKTQDLTGLKDIRTKSNKMQLRAIMDFFEREYKNRADDGSETPINCENCGRKLESSYYLVGKKGEFCVYCGLDTVEDISISVQVSEPYTGKKITLGCKNEEN